MIRSRDAAVITSKAWPDQKGEAKGYFKSLHCGMELQLQRPVKYSKSNKGSFE